MWYLLYVRLFERDNIRWHPAGTASTSDRLIRYLNFWYWDTNAAVYTNIRPINVCNFEASFELSDFI